MCQSEQQEKAPVQYFQSLLSLWLTSKLPKKLASSWCDRTNTRGPWGRLRNLRKEFEHVIHSFRPAVMTCSVILVVKATYSMRMKWPSWWWCWMVLPVDHVIHKTKDLAKLKTIKIWKGNSPSSWGLRGKDFQVRYLIPNKQFVSVSIR